jgi:hypothetical protein
MDFCDEVEYLIDLLKNHNKDIDEIKILNRLEKILDEYAKKYQKRDNS